MNATRIKDVFWSVGAVLVGYILFVLGAFVAQEVILGGVSYLESSHLKLAAAGVLTPLAAVVGGAATALLAPSRPFLHLIPMFVLIGLETLYLYATGRVDGPFWFEAMAGLSLIIGGGIGAWFAVAFIRSGSRREVRR